MTKSNLFKSSSAGRALLAAGLLAAASLPAFAGDDSADAKLSKSVIEPEEEPSRLHLLLQVEVGDHYMTPRGLDVVDSGASFQPLTVVMFDLYRNKDSWLNLIQLWGSYWNDVGTSKYGATPGYWNEIDFAGGVDIKFCKGFDLNISYSSFHSETDSYATNGHFEATLTYHDSFMGPFSINPSVWYFQELHKTATVTFSATDTDPRAFYFEPGIDPTYKCDPFPLTIELPTYVQLNLRDFYQKFNGDPGGSGAGIFSSGIKASVPLKFIPKSYGSWTVYAGFQYYYVNNQGALDGNQALTGKGYEQRDLYRIYGGVSIFF